MSSAEGTGTEGTGTATTSTSTTDGKETSGTTSTAGDEFKPITSQDDLNRIISDRVKRAEAKYSDYKDAKAKASQFDALTEAQKTELQKASDRAEAAEKRAADLEAADAKRIADAEVAKQVADWKDEVSKETGVAAGVLRGSTKADLLAHAKEIQALLPDPNRRGGGAHVPAEGRAVAAGGSDPRQQFAEILKNA